MPGTHRTPPDADGDYLEVAPTHPPGTVFMEMHAGGGWCIEIAPDALPALVAALAAHLTDDDRRALTRDLAARDGDVVVGAEDARCGSAWIEHGLAQENETHAGPEAASTRLFEAADESDRLRAAVEAAHPTPTPEETL